MRHLLTLIIGSVIVVSAFMIVDWSDIDFSLPILSGASNDEIESEDDNALWIDTIMYAKGHSFGYSGDISSWGGWYVDTICVGEDPMLSYDSVGPSTLKLSLVTRHILVDIGDPDAVEKIRDFLKPIDGFRRFEKNYEYLDSVIDDEDDVVKYIGIFSFIADYADSCNENADKINQFTCQLANISEIENAKVSSLSAFYAGYNPAKTYRPIYTGHVKDILTLSDFIAHRVFENWRREDEFDMGFNEAKLEIRYHISNERFVTFSKYEYDREGPGHGMYTETFHTFNLETGKRLTNKDIFKSQSFNRVKMNLFEVMAKDPKYLAWHGDEVSPKDIEGMIETWQSPSPILKGTEWEEPEKDFSFQLPDGALTNSGIVFSFQPYEIDCWAAGSYHFIVPYETLMPYLTSEAKRLITVEKLK